MKSLLLALLLIAPFAQAQCSHQREFSVEQDPCLDKAAPPPAKVLEAILQTVEAAGVSAEEKKNVAHLLHGVVVHLHNAQQRDMIVRGDSPMSGADNGWFWIVTSIDHHPKAYWMVGLGITIQKHKTNGYADISAGGSAGVSTYCTREFRYNGNVYKGLEPKCEENK